MSVVTCSAASSVARAYISLSYLFLFSCTDTPPSGTSSYVMLMLGPLVELRL